MGLVIFMLFLATPTWAEQACSGQAYVKDKDPKGTNVRADPNGQAKIVAVIPHDEDGVIVTLKAFDNGWIKISEYQSIAGTQKKINGWVNARLLGTGSGRGTVGYNPSLFLYQGPKKSSPRQKIVPDDTGYRLLGCDGEWVHVEQTYPPSKATISGWLPSDSHCPNPVTTCS